MESEPASINNSASSKGAMKNSSSSDQNDEEPYSLSGPSIVLIGTTIAIATLGVPLVAIITDKPLGKESTVHPTAIQIDESKPTLPISLTRAGESSSRDSSRE